MNTIFSRFLGRSSASASNADANDNNDANDANEVAPIQNGLPYLFERLNQLHAELEPLKQEKRNLSKKGLSKQQEAIRAKEQAIENEIRNVQTELKAYHDDHPLILKVYSSADNKERFKQSLLALKQFNETSRAIHNLMESLTKLVPQSNDYRATMAILHGQLDTLKATYTSAQDQIARARQGSGAAAAAATDAASTALAESGGRSRTSSTEDLLDSVNDMLDKYRNLLVNEIQDTFGAEDGRLSVNVLSSANNPVFQLIDVVTQKSYCLRLMGVNTVNTLYGDTPMQIRHMRDSDNNPVETMMINMHACEPLGCESMGSDVSNPDVTQVLEITDFANGGSLESFYDENMHGKKSNPEIAYQLAQDMLYLVTHLNKENEHGIYYTDIKPGNLLRNYEEGKYSIVIGDTKAYRTKLSEQEVASQDRRSLEPIRNAEVSKPYLNSLNRNSYDMIQLDNLLGTAYELLMHELPPMKEVKIEEGLHDKHYDVGTMISKLQARYRDAAPGADNQVRARLVEPVISLLVQYGCHDKDDLSSKDYFKDFEQAFNQMSRVASEMNEIRDYSARFVETRDLLRDKYGNSDNNNENSEGDDNNSNLRP